jgi:hypothetical protein
MNPDDFKRAWQAQTSHSQLKVDAELLLQELRRNHRSMTATIFWRDVREVGVSLLLVPLWLYLGAALSLPWGWYLTVPVLLWIAGFMLADRKRCQRQHLGAGESLRRSVESSLAQVEHQIWLLRNVLWWGLLPLALPILAFFTQVAWQTRSGGWWTALAFTGLVTVAAVVLVGVYRLNQNAIRSDLEPRHQELEAILAHLSAADEASVEGTEAP